MPNDDTPESTESQVEGIRRGAASASDYQLDEHLAVATARRDVAAAHGRTHTAEVWQEVTLALAEVRRARAQHAREIEDLTGPPPPIVRPLTPEELEGDTSW